MKIESKQLSISDENQNSEHFSLDNDSPEFNSPIDEEFPLCCNKKNTKPKEFIKESIIVSEDFKNRKQISDVLKETIVSGKENKIQQNK